MWDLRISRTRSADRIMVPKGLENKTGVLKDLEDESGVLET
ncbi:hypothetical protein PENSTE_c006G02690 [Penicillium steckii]|uniref:Uncharacterized protein n=1 Tax=Penicillium steckii TaxID=303698 RepID=A0A1V6TH05_9EURO|nr:hypothetical protein PENSTE_c006G02690 [Penicillium steckii]